MRRARYFTGFFFFFFVFVFEPRLRFLMSQPRNPIFIYALLIIKLSERQNIDLKALSYIPRDMKCGAKPCSVPNRSCTRCLLRYRYPLHSVLEIYPSHPSRQANVLIYLISGPGCGISSRCARLEHSHELGASNRSHRNKSHPPPNSRRLLATLGDAAARARDRLHHYNVELDDSMLAQPQGHFTQALFHAEMLCARGEIFKVFPSVRFFVPSIPHILEYF